MSKSKPLFRFIKLAYAGESDYEGVRTWRWIFSWDFFFTANPGYLSFKIASLRYPSMLPYYRYTSPASTYDPSLPENRAYCHLKSTVQYFDNSSVQIRKWTLIRRITNSFFLNDFFLQPVAFPRAWSTSPSVNRASRVCILANPTFSCRLKRCWRNITDNSK